MKSYKHLFSRALAASPGRIHFAAHSHHLWPDASCEGHVASWDDAALLADRKWEKVFGEVIPESQRHVADELHLPDPTTIAFTPNTHEFLSRIFTSKWNNKPIDVLTTDGEFHAFRRQSARWEERGLIKRRFVACEPFGTFTQRYLAAMREQPAEIAFLSHVMFRTGLRFDGVEELASYASPEGTWVALDLYHSFMAMPCDFSKVADRVFLMGGGYKYAMAGENAAYLHAPRLCAAPSQNRLVRRFRRDGRQARRSRLWQGWFALPRRDVRSDRALSFQRCPAHVGARRRGHRGDQRTLRGVARNW
ncbi:MAG: hypothetical protein IPG56_06640 [Caulobacteraceae bacterium]|nr:hypothetical protein [Caulobacteraceae bacterium]